jgi:hypothetical protein
MQSALLLSSESVLSQNRRGGYGWISPNAIYGVSPACFRLDYGETRLSVAAGP